MEIITLLAVGVGLSMDAFSLALCYGILNIKKNRKNMLSFTVGLFHFFMPLIGMLFGNIIEHYITVDMRYVVFVIFMFLGLEMIFSAIRKDTNVIILNGVGIILFAITVSIDSFSAGIGIKFISDKYLLCSTIFSITSLLFTYIGLLIGQKVGAVCNDKAKLFGGIVLIIIALNNLFR